MSPPLAGPPAITEPAHPSTAGLVLARAEDDAPALLFEEQAWSWRELVAEAAVRASLAETWRRDDPAPSDRALHVGVLADNVPDYVFWLAAAALGGFTVVGVNPTRRGAELAADIRATDCDALLVDPTHADLLTGLGDRAGHGASRVELLGSPSYDAQLVAHAGAPPHATTAALDPATTLMLLFTSGSTGTPKAVICSTGRFAIICQLNPMQLDRADVAYNAMPLFHGNAVMASWGPCLVAGATFSMRRRFSASGFLPDVQRFGATYFNYVGRSLSYLLARPESTVERDNRLRFGFGTEASARDRAEFERRYGTPVVESYGSSEGVAVIRCTDDTPSGALGVPPPGYDVDLVDAEGRSCPPARFSDTGELLNAEQAIGEIVARGARVRFEGYYANPEATAEKVRGDDVWTGDLAYRDADGWYWFAGRTADWLRVDSENFAAAPVERILARFPGVAVAAVYPVPDPVTGDRVMVTLQLVEDADFDAASFAAFLRDQPDLGTKWAPWFVRVTRDLPVTATRKVDKPSLRTLQWGGDDPVWERSAGGYVRLDDARRGELRDEFASHGRAALLR